jgi:hypothetical protein
MVAQRDRPIAAQPQNQIAKQSCGASDPAAINLHSAAIHGCCKAAKLSALVGGEAIGCHVPILRQTKKLLLTEKFSDRRQ